jgi:CRP-like cAMP-binding protein
VSTKIDISAGTVRNRLLRVLPPDALGRLSPRLERVTMAPGTRLQSPHEATGAAYFVEGGFLSCFAGENGRDQTEVALIGREGLSGLSCLLGANETPFSVVVQRGGDAYRITTQALREACRESAPLLATLMRYAYAVSVQIAETGRANARQTVEARLARWLLMAHDRIDGNEIELTHENLSTILGVRRPGITVALHVLEGEHMIRARRGAIQILDRTKLERAAHGSYGLSEREYERVLGGASNAQAAG